MEQHTAASSMIFFNPSRVWWVCAQQGASGRLSTRMSVVESTQNEFKQQLSDLVHTSQQNTLVLHNLSSMFAIMMEKMGNSATVCEPKSATPQNTNSHMPSSEPMLASWDGSAGDTTLKVVSKVIETEAPTNVAKLSGEGVMGGGRKSEGASEVGASTVNGTEALETLAGAVLEGGAEAVGEPTRSQDGIGKDGFGVCAKGAGSGTLIEGSGDGEAGIALAVEGGSGGSANGEGRCIGGVNVDMAPPLSPRKRDPPTPRRKNKPHSPNRVGGSGSQEAHPIDQVSSDIERIGNNCPVKLLIFNVHGTLLDCSLLTEPNPNTSIRVTTRSSTRRMVFRPWLVEFIDKCFRNFRVAFWGIKSTSNMEDVVASMLRKFNGLDSHKPVFIWSAKECEEVSENVGASRWKKPLSKVWEMWPEWNEGNTVIIDHYRAMVECNPVANFIIPPPFYVDGINKLADDNNYLRHELWPILKGLVDSHDVHNHASVLPNTQPTIADHSRSEHTGGRTTRSSKMKLPETSLSGHPPMSG